MIPDRWRKIVAVLGGDPEQTDAQNIEHARNVVRERDVYRTLYRLRPREEKPWGQVRLGQLIEATQGPDAGQAVWMLTGKKVRNKDELELTFVNVVRPVMDWQTMTLVRPAQATARVLGQLQPGDGVEALEALAAELGARSHA